MPADMSGAAVINVLQVHADRLRGWLNTPHRAADRWLGGPALVAAWLGLLLAAVGPPHGAGIPSCWFQGTTGLPCPGCGLTRSLSCGLRGMFQESFQFHPLGLPILALFIFLAAQGLLSRVQRAGIAGFMRSHAAVFNGVYLAFVISFVGFGTLRALHHFVMLHGGGKVAVRPAAAQSPLVSESLRMASVRLRTRSFL